MIKSPYKHIVFDIDGTLLDSEKTGLVSLRQTVKEILGKDLPIEQLYPYFGMSSRTAVRQLGFPDLEYAAMLWEKHFQELMHWVEPFEGVEETLKALKKAGKTVGIITSRLKEELEYDPNLQRWMPGFDCVICARDTEKHKPHPEPMLCYLQKLRAKPAETLYIGDTIYDCRCALDAGTDFGLALWGCKNPDGIPATYAFESFKQLRDFFLL